MAARTRTLTMNMRNILVWAILLVLLLALFNMLQGPSQSAPSNEINYSQFMNQVESGQVSSVTIQGDTITGQLGILVSWFPMLLLIGVWIFFMRQMQGGGRGKPWALASPRRSF
jgi:cell division protease FtsH